MVEDGLASGVSATSGRVNGGRKMSFMEDEEEEEGNGENGMEEDDYDDYDDDPGESQLVYEYDVVEEPQVAQEAVVEDKGKGKMVMTKPLFSSERRSRALSTDSVDDYMTIKVRGLEPHPAAFSAMHTHQPLR